MDLEMPRRNLKIILISELHLVLLGLMNETVKTANQPVVFPRFVLTISPIVLIASSTVTGSIQLVITTWIRIIILLLLKKIIM